MLGIPEATKPGGLLCLDGLVFVALIEGILRERSPEIEQAVEKLYAEAAAPAPTPTQSPDDRNAAIQRMMRFGG